VPAFALVLLSQSANSFLQTKEDLSITQEHKDRIFDQSLFSFKRLDADKQNASFTNAPGSIQQGYERFQVQTKAVAKMAPMVSTSSHSGSTSSPAHFLIGFTTPRDFKKSAQHLSCQKVQAHLSAAYTKIYQPNSHIKQR
jgi:hypothetical protein